MHQTDPMASLRNVMERQQGDRIANVLAIGTANPSNVYYQADYPDFYFKLTNSEHMTDLKQMFQRLCNNSEIKKRHMQLSEETIKENPNLGIYKAASLTIRQEIIVEEVPKLGKEAALKAIEEWGQPMSRITHLVFASSTGVNMPSADVQLVKLLGLSPTIKRYMIYQQGCIGGGAALRLAKDLAERNVGSRVLIVCAELFGLWTFHAPSYTHLDVLIASTILGDGAAAVIVGADPYKEEEEERPLFQIVAAVQTLIPDTQDHMVAKIREMGVEYYFSPKTPETVEKNAKQCVGALFDSEQDWNDLFYVVHPGASSILKGVEENLNLAGDKLKASRKVLSEYGNIGSSAVFFVMDEMRKKSKEEGKTTTGDGFDWGVLLAFGPGFSAETMLLRSYTIDKERNAEPSWARL